MCVCEREVLMHRGNVSCFCFFECIWLYNDVCCKCACYGLVHGYICEEKCTCVRVCVCARVEACL